MHVLRIIRRLSAEPAVLPSRWNEESLGGRWLVQEYGLWLDRLSFVDLLYLCIIILMTMMNIPYKQEESDLTMKRLDLQSLYFEG